MTEAMTTRLNEALVERDAARRERDAARADAASVREALRKQLDDNLALNRQRGEARAQVADLATALDRQANDWVKLKDRWDEARAELTEARKTIDMLNDLHRDAVGVPASEHQTRRLETMAQAVEQAQAELRAQGLPTDPTKCICTELPEHLWTTHYGHVDPATQVEYEPACPVHSVHVWDPKTCTWEFRDGRPGRGQVIRSEEGEAVSDRSAADEAVSALAVKYNRVRRERDEARAEVERLRRRLELCQKAVADDAED